MNLNPFTENYNWKNLKIFIVLTQNNLLNVSKNPAFPRVVVNN